ncbi:homogentisate 1,2-dioxygenase [Sugiyamaella lignohabitans]|uniref:homogentisate 1,2-dioxygenase n=1 Tax=Sugiyamaella lignohabitans TaxID=796027 RepID=A0A167FD12_9ASCO|nr:homogentisate 1,2-dioxygenase [Sugiyamaella lignohabitans]ANB15138.1 homogentisate 1,2-dioxygenase [Sugiyamaella lignohabitans]
MVGSNFTTKDPYKYQVGFNSYHETEAIEGALPVGQNSPQEAPYGLYSEKLSGTAFTAPRHENKQSWLYRVIPGASHPNPESVKAPWASSDGSNKAPAGFDELQYVPNQLRWDPFDVVESETFVDGLRLVSASGDPRVKKGLAIYAYGASKSMGNEAFYNADGDFLIVPQQGELDIQTELGNLYVRPQEIVVIPRGIRYKVKLPSGPIRGYILEVFSGHFELPELGPIGSNCLANARDFQAPVAAFEENDEPHKILGKFGGNLFQYTQNHSPFDVVGWHGLYYPYKYDLGKFNTIGSVSFDHPDPSIFTVLTVQSEHVGTAIADFVIFPPRWLVQEHTFRPPWFHRNTMAEFMGLICGNYDAKEGGGFVPGGASLHNVMSSHGPDAATYEKASKADLKPQKVGTGSIAFMFETSLMLGLTTYGLTECNKVQSTYNEHSWLPIKKHFVNPQK